MAKNARVNEEALLKALDRLESGETDEKPLKKGALPKNTKEADGGLSGKGGEGPDAGMEIEADENFDPTKGGKKSTTADEKEDVVEKADDSDSDEEEEDTQKGESDDEDEEDTQKSLREIMEEDDTVSKAIEVSDFLEHFVDQTSEAVDGLAKSLRTSAQTQAEFNAGLRKAIVAMGNMLVELNGKIESFGEEAPAAPRSVMSKALTAGAIENRNFAGGEQPQFSREQALNALCSLAEAGKVHPAVVTQYETTGSLPREVQSAVDSFLRQN